MTARFPHSAPPPPGGKPITSARATQSPQMRAGATHSQAGDLSAVGSEKRGGVPAFPATPAMSGTLPHSQRDAGGGVLLPKLRVLDLFSGIGGFSLGLERTGGFETVAFCEIEEFPRRVLAKHWPEVPCYEDVTKLTGNILERDGIAVDVITGGFPCQDISAAGKRVGMSEGTRSGLWSEIVRLIGELRPQYVVVENVANLLSGPSEKRGGWFGRVLGDLAECGYDAEWENIPAAAVGAHHRRERVWIVAYPEQVERFRPIFAGDDAAKGAWGNKAIRLPNGVRSEVGSALPAISRVWVDQPGPDGMVDGFSDWPHRLGGCGNAVVPQIPEMIGRAILGARQ